MDSDISLEIGQVVRSIGNQISVPDWYEKWGYGIGTVAIGDKPVIRLSCKMGTHGAPDEWNIHTNCYRQSGLICFVPKKYLGMAILSVRITRVSKKSVTAEPVEWIEVNSKLGVDHIGKTAQEVFDSYLEKVDEKLDGAKDFDEQDTSSLDYTAVWHGKNT